ncbi:MULTISPECIES: lysozyme inhibitor LprI family protein [unclassified Rhizobium]|uniref:lysozyme inhibitor LprI family protein n=1 Tax=unclassified Rhizobium TaxID=2613769 RepID=UPI001ADD3AB5|nr:MULTISPECIES: lysozyme inhibitor LprI family protein [unclassified Rhizobium]MBO9099223.1 lysozyme inhibitor LprI family protein [Rhizobium sp. L58/93]MBO9131971.1 lysozyme inhibitor LprI family protein [Rhizobium sp. B209b/85]MBO9169485.1 lysozyme inhibitor LprI family protein [Rhizobium sp. L245/93]MBO9185436.1 lysozyme inhibitor LprI family protein [Rhizobium sp. E27B/91]QXZ85570.1 lysozyme inhibitor LprI family protein [Rhizobium sp. K1/93]
MRFNLMMAAAGMMMAMAHGVAMADETPDCSKAETQMDMNICAEQDFDTADAELNTQYKKTRASLQAVDADLEADMKGAEKALLAGQRGWIAYRDGHCDAEGFQARGGSMEPMLVSSCKATMTRLRTKELKEMAEGLGN